MVLNFEYLGGDILYNTNHNQLYKYTHNQHFNQINNHLIDINTMQA